MTDSYQAIYDAVRSKISGGNIGDVVAEAAKFAFDISWSVDAVKTEFISAAIEHQRPSAVFRPDLIQDGNAWLAIYGELPTGVVGAGSTPEEAMADFDRAWRRPAKASPSSSKGSEG